MKAMQGELGGKDAWGVGVRLQGKTSVNLKVFDEPESRYPFLAFNISYDVFVSWTTKATSMVKNLAEMAESAVS